ncbi:hypothetical protein [Nocardia vinacea]|uniref:hypothetical protein n=1 Tax=Nocardia vinacea TaxID=96468 RepID=UPI0012F6C801|nr:hypothetical protein [Nocardia vinacea]
MTLRVPSPWDRSAFLEQMTMLVGKQIHLLPLPATMTTGLPCGLALADLDARVRLPQRGGCSPVPFAHHSPGRGHQYRADQGDVR